MAKRHAEDAPKRQQCAIYEINSYNRKYGQCAAAICNNNSNCCCRGGVTNGSGNRWKWSANKRQRVSNKSTQSCYKKIWSLKANVVGACIQVGASKWSARAWLLLFTATAVWLQTIDRRSSAADHRLMLPTPTCNYYYCPNVVRLISCFAFCLCVVCRNLIENCILQLIFKVVIFKAAIRVEWIKWIV